ncbi:MAG: glutamyl-tRNA reductase, partial [Bacteroidota bacterium]
NPQLEASQCANLMAKLVFLEGEEALRHLFEVAASIDSMVIGEREILRQLREAYDRCTNWNLTGDNIRLAMKTTVEAAKEVYAKTRIGEKPISIVSLAIQQLLESKLSRSARILLIGAGQTNTLVAKFLKKHDFTNVVVFNRSIEKAERLSELLGEGARALALDRLASYSEGFDAIITCTGHTQSWIDSELYTQLLRGGEEQKLVIDLAVPNNLTEATRAQFPIHYIDVEHLRSIARENLAFREREVTQARKLLTTQLYDFHSTYQHRSIIRAMHRVPEAIKAVKSHAMNEVFAKELRDLNPESRQLLERMMDYMERRCISIPMQAAKEVAQ